MAFAESHPGWPDGGWIRRRREAQLLANSEAAAKVAAYFASEPPQTSAGMIAAARAANATGRFDEGARIIRALWRDGDFDHSTETLILREFGAALTRADHKYRADRLLYVESFESALRAAALAGPDIFALARARIAAARGQLTPALRMAVPPALRNDPGLLFARIRDARRSNRAYEAAVLLELRRGSRGLDQPRPLVERTAEGRGRTARPRRAAPRVRTLRQHGQTGRFRRPDRRRLPCRLDRVAVPRQRSRRSTAVRAGC